MTRNEVNFSSRFGVKGTIKGTVTSGDPLKTTFGNTLRVYLYNKWIMQDKLKLESQ